MNNHDADLANDFAELQAKFKDITEKMSFYENDIKKLQSLLDLTELSVKEAEQRAKSAEELAEKAKEKYSKAIELKDGQYDELIHDLFRTPQDELVKHIETQSKISNKKAAKTAVISIIVGILISVLLLFVSEARNSKKMDENQKLTQEVLSKMDSVIENIWATDMNIKRIVLIIDQSKSDFHNYESKNALALLFKTQMSEKISDVKYGDYLKAFRVSKIKREFIPVSEDELRRWDDEFLKLCEAAISRIEFKMRRRFLFPSLKWERLLEPIPTPQSNKNKISPNKKEPLKKVPSILSNDNIPELLYSRDISDDLVTEEESRYATYKTEDDKTNYFSSGWVAGNLTYKQLLSNFKSKRDAIQKRIDFNK